MFDLGDPIYEKIFFTAVIILSIPSVSLSVSSKRFRFKINRSYNMLHVWLLESSDPPKVAMEKDS